MGTSFSEFMQEVEAEARREGPRAVAELAFFEAPYQLATDLILLRRRRRLSLRLLAARSGVPVANVREIEGGRANPMLATIVALARALGAELTLTTGAPGQFKAAAKVRR